MAYSDYGGYAYRNGIRDEQRSDAVLSPEGIKSTPGSWPGWTIPEGRYAASYHVLLGDGPIFVGLYKQSTIRLHRLGEEIELPADFVEDDDADSASRFEIDGYTLEAIRLQTDNHYIYARLTQPDGVVWTGFSGYGVGAGLEDAGYGFSTDACEETLRSRFSAD